MRLFLLKSLGLELFLCFGVVLTASLSSATPLVLTPDGATLFVVNADSGSVSAINTLSAELFQCGLDFTRHLVSQNNITNHSNGICTGI